MDFSDLGLIISQFHFIRPWWWILILPFLVLFILQWKGQDTPASWQKRLPEHLRKALTVGETGWKRKWPIAVLFIMTIFVIIVCAGPAWKKESSPFHQNDTPLVIVLDSGVAMMETDVAPDRLTRAKQKIIDMLKLRAGGKTALIVYSGSAHLAMPLTQDTDVFKPMLEAISPDIMPVEGKNSAAAITLVNQQLGASSINGTVLLITNDVTSQSAPQWQRYIDKSKAQLIVLAAGNAEKPSDIPLKLDVLNHFSDDTDGKLIQMSVDDDDIMNIIHKVENHAAFNTQNDQPWQDMGYGFLIPVMMMILLWFRKGWVVQWAWFGVIGNGLLIGSLSIMGQLSLVSSVKAEQVHTFSNSAQSASNEIMDESITEKVGHAWMGLWFTPDQQGQWYFNRGEYLKAAQRYQDPLRKGVAFYYASQFESAFKVLNQSNDLDMQLNAASALARQREYVKARSLLRYIVKKYPSNKIAAHNLNLIEQLIEEINQFSESQDSGDDGNLDSSRELGDAPQTADGAETELAKSQLLEQKLTAEQLLADDSVVDKWMQRIETNPKDFLRAKFAIQYQNSQQERD